MIKTERSLPAVRGAIARPGLRLRCESTRLEPRLGTATAKSHHGELLQGVVEHAGVLRRALVSLPCEVFGSRASFEPDRHGGLVVDAAWRTKSLRAAEVTLHALGLETWGGQLRIDSATPLRLGYGSSTSDVAATIRAVAGAFGVTLGPAAIAQLAVRAEHACDSTIFETETVLFAHHEGEVLEVFGEFPALEILSFNTDPDGVDTLAFQPARYTWWEIEAFRPLLGMLRRAFHDGDARLLGHVATASARINQRFLPKPQLDHLEAIVAEVGGLGIQIAHSGTLVGLLFEPGQDARIRDAAQALASIGIRETRRFRVA